MSQAPTAVAFEALAHEDVEFAARISGAMDADHPITPAELLQRWQNTERTCIVQRAKVVAGGTPAGWLSVVKDNSDTTGAVEAYLMLPGSPPEVQAAGIAHLEEMASSIGARHLEAGAVETTREAVTALETAPGWRQERRIRYWRLAVAPNAERLLELREASRKRMGEARVELRTCAELGGPRVYTAIYDIDVATTPDIPSSLPLPVPSFEDWLVWFQPPRIRDERIWLALVDGKPVGYSTLGFQPSLVETYYTGVLREYRNRGIARALKLETLGQAVELGVEAVETDNDAENAPILKLNTELGYQELPSRLIFQRDLD